MASSTPDFDSKTFYTFSNPSLTNYSLSAGIFLDTNGAINMTTSGAYSSENWQIYSQGGRYFIRNYDYGPEFQLGLTAQSRGIPMLYRRSGGLGQQWSIMKKDDGWEFTNGLLGNGTGMAVPLQGFVGIAMQASSRGRTWKITQNPSAEESGPKGPDMYSEVLGFEVSQSSSSSISSSLRTASTASASVTPSGTSLLPSSASTTPTSTFASSASPLSSSSSSLSSGAIAGVAIGGVSVLALAIYGLWFWARKRKMAKEHQYELQGHNMPVEKYAYRAELESPRQVWEKDTVAARVELA
ncbi:uncharacterized protein K460DRAFT_171952 [Cucurbitaria berberidis CBS 394.84]|uniref:Ricin B lectin domain-containing protein n=1 Tax=Cucurbitaria berberidis CBS 394.84 TaxID=1168544 RepID=A0A9P4GAK8_9PLEO|nr:uncharacterized protein K460DRAFT_171952 [Cucurbitaria berberidis CBS 394.84]KAF1841720.1 hypothetical protein K460DRAFT_171952 [Cucurbitaria berberidis CBS 394.84]